MNLTLDQIDRLPAGRMMDQLVGEMVMGWHRVPELNMWCRTRTNQEFPNETEEWLRKFPDLFVGYAIEYIETTNESEDGPFVQGYTAWEPSKNVACAWEVAKKFLYANITFDSVTWGANFDNGIKRHIANADIENPNVELAICRASLKFHATDSY